MQGILRVGGRLENAPVVFESKQPAILPNKHHFTCLVICHHHLQVGHSSISHTWTRIQKKFWILKGAVVRREINTCIFCHKHNVPEGQQLMFILPSARLKADNSPFSYNGVDYFSPYYVKQAICQ